MIKERTAVTSGISDDEFVRLITDEILNQIESGKAGVSVSPPIDREPTADSTTGPWQASTPPRSQTIGRDSLPADSHMLSSTLLPDGIPIGVSVRHIHLSREDCDALFGKDYELKKVRQTYQHNQFACEETLTVVGPKGCITRVRVLSPLRRKTQIEVARTDAIQLGLMPPIRGSVHEGKGSPSALAGPKGSIVLEDSLIRMRRHIHMHPDEAASLRLKDGDVVDVRVPGAQGLIFCNTDIRTHQEFRAEMHIDTDEGNAAGIC